MTAAQLLNAKLNQDLDRIGHSPEYIAQGRARAYIASKIIYCWKVTGAHTIPLRAMAAGKSTKAHTPGRRKPTPPTP